MAKTVRILGGEGCCACADQTGCECDDGTCVTGAVECRTRGGNAFLCGFEEYTEPSSPPKFYKTKTLSGSLTVCFYGGIGDPDCSEEFHSSRKFDFSGVCGYTDCTITDFGSVTESFNEADCGGGDGSPDVTDDCGVGVSYPDGWTETLSSNERTVVGNGTCTISESIIYPNYIVTGSATEELSDEDTPAAAIARISGFEDDWIVAGETGCDGTPPSCCLARWQVYDGFPIPGTFAYQEAQFRVQLTGLTPSTVYEVPIDIYRRLFETGSFVLYATLYPSGTSDGSGNLTVSGDVPNIEGYESYAVIGTCP